MAISDSQKLDYLWKKIGYGFSKTDTLANKLATNESIPSPFLLRGENIWNQSEQIPDSIPSSSGDIVSVYPISSPVECISDITSSSNRTWKTGLIDWIPPEIGATYLVKVYIHDSGDSANASSSGEQVLAAGSGNNDEWFFDYQSGLLHFIGNNLPNGIDFSGKSVYVSGARYVGGKGVSSGSSDSPGSGISSILQDTTPQLGGDLDLNSNNITGIGNLNISGIVTATSLVKDGGTSFQFLKADGSVDESTYLTSANAGIDYLSPDGDGSELTNVIAEGLSGTPDINVGLVTAFAFSGDGSELTNVIAEGLSGTPDINVGLVTAVSFSGDGSELTNVIAEGLSGTPDINVGVVTASTFVGDGSSLTGIVTSIQAGSNITITESPSGNFVINSTATGSGGISEIGIEDDGISVGTGITSINFGDNLNVSVSDGVATITASGTAGHDHDHDDDGSATETHSLSFSRSTTQLVASVGQTQFAVNYNVGFVDIFVNGVRLTSTEYIATDGTSITLSKACFGGENLDVIAYDTKTTRITTEFTAICGQREFRLDYNVGFIDVFVNGVRLTKSEYVATNGTSIILSEACFRGDNVDVISYDTANGNVRDMSDAPANSDDPGIPGQTAYDLKYFYICVAPNSWKRTYLHSW